MIAQVPSMSDDRVIEVARDATSLEAQSYRLRGACAAEIKRRIRARLAEDPDSRGKEELRIRAQLSNLAAEIGVAYITLDEDARIYERFGGNIVDNVSPREVYRLALTARDPQAAVDLYVVKKDGDARYSTADFRRDISELNRGKSNVPTLAARDLHRLHFDLPGKAIAALKVICDRLQCDDEEALSRALVYSARAVEDGNDI
jgi:hypothetical protein